MRLFNPVQSGIAVLPTHLAAKKPDRSAENVIDGLSNHRVYFFLKGEINQTDLGNVSSAPSG